MIAHAPRNVAWRRLVRRNSRLVGLMSGDDRHISLKKPLGDGELVCQGFRVHDDGDTIEFTGKAYMKIYPKQKNREGQGG